MEVTKASQFLAAKAWGAKDIASMNGISVRLHWTNKPYRWHVNDGEEVFVVLAGKVNMHYRNAGQALSVLLEVGDIFYASVGTEHVAHPVGEARVLVVEQEGSI